MIHINLTLNAGEEELLNKIIEKSKGSRQNTILECIRMRYFDLYPIRKVSESVNAAKPPAPHTPKTRKQFIEEGIFGMDVTESLKWQDEHKEEINTYPYNL